MVFDWLYVEIGLIYVLSEIIKIVVVLRVKLLLLRYSVMVDKLVREWCICIFWYWVLLMDYWFLVNWRLILLGLGVECGRKLLWWWILDRIDDGIFVEIFFGY